VSILCNYLGYALTRLRGRGMTPVFSVGIAPAEGWRGSIWRLVTALAIATKKIDGSGSAETDLALVRIRNAATVMAARYPTQIELRRSDGRREADARLMRVARTGNAPGRRQSQRVHPVGASAIDCSGRRASSSGSGRSKHRALREFLPGSDRIQSKPPTMQALLGHNPTHGAHSRHLIN
jgi:hypothetical protein